MSTPLLWLAIYLAAGAAVLWMCYKTSACRMRERHLRNTRIMSFVGSPDGAKTQTDADLAGSPADREVVAR